MSMQFLSATMDAQGIHYSIWLDTSKSRDGSPDPAYVRPYNWTLNDQATTGITDTAYQQMTLDEVKLLAQADLASIQQAANPAPTPTPLSVQGQTF